MFSLWQCILGENITCIMSIGIIMVVVHLSDISLMSHNLPRSTMKASLQVGLVFYTFHRVMGHHYFTFLSCFGVNSWIISGTWQQDYIFLLFIWYCYFLIEAAFDALKVINSPAKPLFPLPQHGWVKLEKWIRRMIQKRKINFLIFRMIISAAHFTILIFHCLTCLD